MVKLNRAEKVLLANNAFVDGAQRLFEAPKLDRLAGRARGDRALELGCGRGYGVKLILERFGADDVVAIDLDPDQIALAGPRVRRYGDRATVRVGDMCAMTSPTPRSTPCSPSRSSTTRPGPGRWRRWRGCWCRGAGSTSSSRPAGCCRPGRCGRCSTIPPTASSIPTSSSPASRRPTAVEDGTTSRSSGPRRRCRPQGPQAVDSRPERARAGAGSDRSGSGLS